MKVKFCEKLWKCHESLAVERNLSRRTTKLLLGLAKCRFFFPVFGQQPEDSDGFHRESFENGCTRGICLEGSKPPTRARPRTRPSGQWTDRCFRLHHGISMCRMSVIRVRAEIQVDGEEMRGERCPPVWYRCMYKPRGYRDQKVIFVWNFSFKFVYGRYTTWEINKYNWKM